MAAAGLVGVHRRRRQGCTRCDDTATSAEDLVKRVFGVTERDRLWLADITEHHTGRREVGGVRRRRSARPATAW